MSVSAQKARLRAQFLQRRQATPSALRAKMDAQIAERLTALPEFLDRDTALLCYASGALEVDTWRILRVAWATGKRVAMPRCQQGGRMEFFLVRGADELQPGYGNIPEPVARCPLYFPQPDDLCVTPGLSFDREGYRLGFGGGYYDRYLARYAVRTVGLCYPDCAADTLPRESFDICVQQVLY